MCFFCSLIQILSDKRKLYQPLKMKLQICKKMVLVNRISIKSINRLLQEYKEKYKTNDFWLDIFWFYDWIKEPYTNIYRVEQLHQQRTLKEITNIARKYLVKKNYMVLTHLPE